MKLVVTIVWLSTALVWVVFQKSWAQTNKNDLFSQRRVLLETRLKVLEQKKEYLESVPGDESLSLQRRYQDRINRIKKRLGFPVSPFPTNANHAIYQKPPLEIEIAQIPAEEIDVFHDGNQEFFHDARQVQAVTQAIKDHGGIEPDTSLDEELRRRRQYRYGDRQGSVHASRRGIIIDGGDELHKSPMIMPANSEKQVQNKHHSDIQVVSALYGAGEQRSPFLPFRQQTATQTQEKLSAGAVFPLSQNGGDVTGSLSTLPKSGVPPPPVWKQEVSEREYNNKAGWSMDPPPINGPVFFNPFGQGNGHVRPYDSHNRRLDAARRFAQSKGCSFEPKKLVQVWAQG